MREIARTYIGSMKARIPEEYIRLGMKAVLRSIIRNLYLGVTQSGQTGYGIVICSARICRRDDTQPFPCTGELPQTVPKQV